MIFVLGTVYEVAHELQFRLYTNCSFYTIDSTGAVDSVIYYANAKPPVIQTATAGKLAFTIVSVS